MVRQLPWWKCIFLWLWFNSILFEGFVSDVKPTTVKQETHWSLSIVRDTEPVVQPIEETNIRTKTSPPSSPSIKGKKRQAVSAVPASSNDHINDDTKHYSQHELEMEAKLIDYFQMSCDLCMHRFVSWNDARSHYLDQHNVLKPFLRCCNRKYFLRSRIIEHISWHVDPSSFW